MATEPLSELPASKDQPTEKLSIPSWGDRSARSASLDTSQQPPTLPYGPPSDESNAIAKHPQPGKRFGDFEILSLLGEGAFAKVYLARQVSLGRQVALKISANRGTEARTLASLEHNHIVQVFSEIVDAENNLRLLCMQYVPGTTLHCLIHELRGRDRRTWSGQAMLEIIDRQGSQPATLDPAALRDREILNRADFAEAVCWIGGRLAEALAHAHAQHVLHRDIKPANILLSRYGRPMLVDFNVALDPDRVRGASGSVFGGTLGYMSPEHLDAFASRTPATIERVDQCSDIYSMGVVLFELLTGERPFPRVPEDSNWNEILLAVAMERRGPIPSVLPLSLGRGGKGEGGSPVLRVLDRLVRRCLEPEPHDRYQSAAELADALDGSGDLVRARKDLPPPSVVSGPALRHPFLVLLIVTFLPHVLGSIVNIAYNQSQIMDGLSAHQQTVFARLVVGYNLVVYPLALAIIYYLIAPIVRLWRKLGRGEKTPNDQIHGIRRRLLSLPMWAVGLSCLGWLPGGYLFPLGLAVFAGPISYRTFSHFLLSFTISGLIALTYSFFGVQTVVLRAMYPELWQDGRGFRETAAAELERVGGRLRFFQFQAGLIPLAGAILLLSVGPEQFTFSFRFLVTGLITLGMLGFGVTLLASSRLSQTLTALIGIEGKRG
jgi:serine/threonine protein kinase